MEMENKDISLRGWELMLTKTFMMPLFWDYQIFSCCDNFMYHILCYDTVRMDAYRSVIRKTVQGKKVVEIGAGARLPLTLMCAESGAEIIYAIEGNPDAANQAARLAEEKGFSHKIRIVTGHSSEITLPEKADVCLSEIIGCIGSSEGAVVTLKDAKRFLKPDGVMIPQRCVTKIAPVFLPDKLYTDAFIKDISERHVRGVCEAAGREVEFSRFQIFNFPESNLIAEPQIFEDLRFNGSLCAEYAASVSFPISSDSIFQGFLLWLNLYVDSETMIDSFRGTSWGAVYIPYDRGPIALKKGDLMKMECAVTTGRNKVNPDYTFRGKILREQGITDSFFIYSAY